MKIELLNLNIIGFSVLGLRSDVTTPQRSKTARNFFKSMSRSVEPEDVPVGRIASLMDNCMIRLSVFDNESLST